MPEQSSGIDDLALTRLHERGQLIFDARGDLDRVQNATGWTNSERLR